MTTVEDATADRHAAAGLAAAPAEGDHRLLELVHHRRPQEDRHPLRRHRAGVLRARRGRGAAHPAAARGAERHGAHRGAVQHDVHDARHHDGVPRRHAAGGRRSRNYFVPLQIGARDVAFPRLNMFGYWVVLFGGIFMYSSFFLGGAPNGGWFGYTPLTSAPISTGVRCPGTAPTSGSSGIVLLGIGSTTSAINFIVTILNMRAPGHDAHAHAGVLVDDARGRVPHRCSRCRSSPSALIMVFFDRNFGTNFFLRVEGRRSAALPAPVLAVRPSRGVHPDPAGHGHRLGDAAGVLAQAAVRLLGRGVLRHRDRVPRLGRVGAPHVRHRPRARWRSPRSGSRRCSSRSPPA